MSASIRRADILSLSNLRDDGRKAHELRRMRVQLGTLSSCGGSALVEQGLSMALGTVQGPMACRRRSDEHPDQAIIQVTMSMSPFASNGDRRVVNANSDRRFIESTILIQRTLEATILLNLYPKSTIHVHIVLLADDGSRLCTALNAASMACVDAGIAMKDVLCACSAGLSSNNSSCLIDLNRKEESSSGGQPAVVLPCAMLPQRGTVVMSQCEARLPDVNALEQLIQAAMEGCRAVFNVMQAAIRDKASQSLAIRHVMMGNGGGTADDGSLGVRNAFSAVS